MSVPQSKQLQFTKTNSVREMYGSLQERHFAWLRLEEKALAEMIHEIIHKKN